MRIVFICGSLEPGRDGVGDYTRRLAIELIKQGHKTAAIALNDQSVNKIISSVQIEDYIELSVLRLPSAFKAKQRFDYSRKWIDDFNPDILSLQFVPFAFHPKGLPFTLSNQLKATGKGRVWHIMFHELWVGMGVNANSKLIWWGKIQKWLIQSLVSSLKPSAIHTQTKLYQLQLERLGIAANYLPLFSNIPVIIPKDLDLEKIEIFNNEIKSFVFVLFGGIQVGAPVELFTTEAAAFAREHNLQFILRIVGRCGIHQDHWITVWKSAGLSVEVYGEQPAERLSDLLLTANMGITTTPIALVEKSGTVAAMREHGLSVICVRDSWKARDFENLSHRQDILNYQAGNLKECLFKAKISYSPTIHKIGQTLTDDLQPFFTKK